MLPKLICFIFGHVHFAREWVSDNYDTTSYVLHRAAWCKRCGKYLGKENTN